MSAHPTAPATARPWLGYGLGLRPEHYDAILALDADGRRAIDWFEATSENYMVPGGRPLHYLDRVREHWPLVLHGVSLSIGGTDPLDRDYLAALARLADRTEPAWISDHLCWTGIGGHNLHDLLPLPYTEEALAHVAARVGEVQETLGRRILLENVSSYVTFRESAMSEWEFLAAVAERADCLLLFDVNNAAVSAHNHGFDAREFVDGVPPERVWQIHLAGPSENGALLVDTHDSPVRESVWDLYGYAIERFGAVSTMIERDADIPPLADVVAELGRARAVADPILERLRRPVACRA